MSYSKFINTTSIDSPYGMKSINLFYGDIKSSKDELLVVSSHANEKLSPDGAVIRDISSEYSINFEELSPIIVLRGVFGTHVVENQAIEEKTPYKAILVLRIPGAKVVEEGGIDLIEFYEKAMWSLFGSLAALEFRGENYSSMALPLLAGSREYPPLDLMRINILQASRWLKTSRFMNEINFYFTKEEQIKIWNESMNKVLGRRLVEKAKNKVFRALSGELLSILSASGKFKGEKYSPIVEPIKISLRSEPICLQQTAAFGRSLAELIVKRICFSKQIGKKGSFYDNIEKLRNNNIVAPWMISHFHSLRILGNETVHIKENVSYKPVALTDDDLIAVLVSLLRIASFWNEWEEC